MNNNEQLPKHMGQDSGQVVSVSGGQEIVPLVRRRDVG